MEKFRFRWNNTLILETAKKQKLLLTQIQITHSHKVIEHGNQEARS